jgi:threonine dehydratase
MSPLPVTPADVRAARQILAGVVRCTPLEPCRVLSERLAGQVLLKCENLQRAGSFKIRGGYHRLARLDAGQRARGVVAASAGNHAQGVALAAAMLGIKARVFMPTGTPLPKVQATRGYGAEVEFAGHTVDEAIAEAFRRAEADGSVLIHPFDHPDVVAGQGTVGLEILEQCPEVATVLVATGGGGLLAGVAAALADRPDIQVLGVQAAGAAAYPPSIAAGSPVRLQRLTTMADGIAVARPGDIPFAVIQALGAEVLTVSEEQISRALLLLLERAKLVVEPAGAAAVAALLDRELLAGHELRPPVVAVLSGGNIDPLLLLRVIGHGMAAAGRYLELRLRLPDRPGSLAGLLAVLADTDANVLEVRHVRAAPGTVVGEAEVVVQLETQGAQHRERVLAELGAAGYSPISPAAIGP